MKYWIVVAVSAASLSVFAQFDLTIDWEKEDRLWR